MAIAAAVVLLALAARAPVTPPVAAAAPVPGELLRDRAVAAGDVPLYWVASRPSAPAVRVAAALPVLDAIGTAAPTIRP